MSNKEKYIKSLEKNIGISIGLIKRLSPEVYTFYLQNRDKIKPFFHEKRLYISVSDKDLINQVYKTLYGYEPIGNPVGGGFLFSHSDFGDYLDKINFKTNLSYGKGFIPSDEINKLIDPIIKK